MDWSDFKELEKSMIKNKDFNAFEKVFGAAVIGPIVYAIDKADKAVEDITGKGLIERKSESMEKEAEEKKNHPWIWAGKKLLYGTIGGLFGASFHSKS